MICPVCDAEEYVLTGVYLYCVFLSVSRGVASYEGCYNSVDQTSPDSYVGVNC